MFEHTLRVRFQDCDPAGIAFFGKLFEYCHEAFEDFLRSRGAPLDELLRSGLAAPIVHVDADFKKPLRHGDLVRVRIALGKLSARSFRLEYELLNDSGTLLARVALVHAGMAPGGGGAELAGALRAALEALPPAPARVA